MRIAHISDLHFGRVTWNPFQFFSKRFLGNFNFLFKRKKDYDYSRLIDLVDLFKEEGVTHIFITGDLSVTSRKAEFMMGMRYINFLKKEGFTVFTLPGNHDHYTKRADRKKHFYKFFDEKYDNKCPLSLKTDKVTYTKLGAKLWVVGLDTACATSFISSEGHFSKQVEESLEKALENIPKDEPILLLNHFPLFDNDPPKKKLVGAFLLKNLIKKHPNILVYLNGHTHRQTVADLRQSDLPIISDSGSTPEKGACHLFEFSHNGIKLDVFRYQAAWKREQTHTFDVKKTLV